jgi:hypothetical protein
MAKQTRRQRKLNEIDIEKQKLAQLQKEFEDLVARQEDERKCIGIEIDSLLENKNLFCGIILTEENLLDLLKIKFANPQENIKICYQLYIQEKEEENGN